MRITAVLTLMTLLGSTLFGGAQPVLPAISKVAPQDGVVPVDQPQGSQLDRIEMKINQVLAETKKTNQTLDGLPKANRQNTLDIVAAIKELKTCPDCPAEPEVKTGPPPKPKSTVNYRSIKSSRWRINGREWTRSKLLVHLETNPNHRGKFDMEMLRVMSLGQLKALHDDHHDAIASDVVPIDPPRLDSPGNACPGGVCPTFRKVTRLRSRRVVFPNAWWNKF